MFRARGMMVVLTFQSTLSLRRATTWRWCKRLGSSHFNPRSPCGERLRRLWRHHQGKTFQSTLSLRRATRAYKTMCYQTMYFNPRSPCGERRSLHTRTPPFRLISIHALLAESDGRGGCCSFLTERFQSTLSLRRATRGQCAAGTAVKFQSTLSLRRATISPLLLGALQIISIHALLAESDFVPLRFRRRDTHFNPRSPCGERRSPIFRSGAVDVISIHALLAESDDSVAEVWALGADFNPRSPCGERRRPDCLATARPDFNPRSPCGERHHSPLGYPLWRYFNPRSPC